MIEAADLICGSQRVGSNVLCEALTATGVAGRPTEHFMPSFSESDALGHVYAGFEKSRWARERGAETFPSFFQAILRGGATPNGVFGTKLMWSALEALLVRLAELPGCRGLPPHERLIAAFERPRFIYLRRRNQVRQAVSWALAAQTGHYSSWESAARPRLAEPSFDLQLIEGLHRLIREAEAGWDSFFARSRIEPLPIYFEDLAEDLAATVSHVLTWLGIPSHGSPALEALRHQPQATALRSEWEERFRALRPDV